MRHSSWGRWGSCRLLFGVVRCAGCCVFPLPVREVRSIAALARTQLRRLLDVDDGARSACLAIEQRELAGDASSQQCAGRITLGVCRAGHDELAGVDDAVDVAGAATGPDGV